MYLKKANSKNKWLINQLSISLFSLLIALFLIPQPGNTKEKKSSRLPSPPDTGSPEEDFSAGGTRDEKLGSDVCGFKKQQIAYLLGNQNREFTSSAYPTFWFYIPPTQHQIAQIEFAVTELETGKQVYKSVIGKTQQSGITGIELPKEKQYALSPEVTYTWSLEVDCSETDQELKVALEGWLSRVSSDSKLEAQLTAASETEKHRIYLNHNLLYDALTQLAKSRIAQPKNNEIETVWNQLITTLGWHDLIEQESKICLSLINMQISARNQ